MEPSSIEKIVEIESHIGLHHRFLNLWLPFLLSPFHFLLFCLFFVLLNLHPLLVLFLFFSHSYSCSWCPVSKIVLRSKVTLVCIAYVVLLMLASFLFFPLNLFLAERNSCKRVLILGLSPVYSSHQQCVLLKARSSTKIWCETK